MGPLGIIASIFGLIIHIICGLLNARMWWESWQREFTYTSSKMDILFITLISIILGILSILLRLFAWKIAPTLFNWFEKIPNLKDYLDI